MRGRSSSRWIKPTSWLGLATAAVILMFGLAAVWVILIAIQGCNVSEIVGNVLRGDFTVKCFLKSESPQERSPLPAQEQAKPDDSAEEEFRSRAFHGSGDNWDSVTSLGVTVPRVIVAKSCRRGPKIKVTDLTGECDVRQVASGQWQIMATGLDESSDLVCVAYCKTD